MTRRHSCDAADPCPWCESKAERRAAFVDEFEPSDQQYLDIADAEARW